MTHPPFPFVLQSRGSLPCGWNHFRTHSDRTTEPISVHGGVQVALLFRLKLQLPAYGPESMTKQPLMLARARSPVLLKPNAKHAWPHSASVTPEMPCCTQEVSAGTSMYAEAGGDGGDGTGVKLPFGFGTSGLVVAKTNSLYATSRPDVRVNTAVLTPLTRVTSTGWVLFHHPTV